MKKSSNFAADRSTSYKYDTDNYKNLPSRTNFSKAGGDSFSYNYSHELPTRTRNVMGNLGNISTQSKLTEPAIDRKYTSNMNTKNSMIENIDRIQSKIKGVLGQHW